MKPGSKSSIFVPAQRIRLPVELRRTSAVLFIRTIPSGVSVRIDGEMRGTTQAAPDGGERSQTALIEGLVPRAGAYRFGWKRTVSFPAASELARAAIGEMEGSGSHQIPSSGIPIVTTTRCR